MESDELNGEVEREHLSSEEAEAPEPSMVRRGESADAQMPSGFNLFQEALIAATARAHVIKVLIVVDGGINFGRSSYGLSLFLDALKEYSPTIDFQITKATRNASDKDAHHTRFSFEIFENGPKLDDFHEVWLFGSESDLKKKLTKKELKILAKFMDCGGGVFATGDHEALGAAMCGEVPRVRFMRKWFFKPSIPPCQPEAIPRDNELRHDTTNRGDDYEFEYTDMMDDYPQMIFPKLDTEVKTCCSKPRPHFVLTNLKDPLRFDDPIRFLPDHSHEGECYVPEKLDHRFKFCGYEGEDFPPGADGERIKPEVIARALVPHPHRTQWNPTINLPTTQVASFGVVGAYNGHRVGRGRVIVDSSFHHFVNFNLTGLANSRDDVNENKGQRAYKQIKTYFGNIGLWLSRTTMQREVYMRALVASLSAYPLIEEILTSRTEINTGCPSLRAAHSLGAAARATMGSMISVPLAREQSVKLLQDLLEDHNRAASRTILDSSRIDAMGIVFGIDFEVIIDVFMGYVVAVLSNKFDDDTEALFKATDAELRAIIAAGFSQTRKVFSDFFSEYASQISKVAKAFG